MTNNSVGSAVRVLWAGLRALLVLTVVCGVLYPLAVTGLAQTLFHDKANGSEIKDTGGRVVGSALIGQTYPDLKWFQPRPSRGLGTNSVNTQYHLLVSGATNKAANNPELVDWVKQARATVVRDNSVPGFTVRPQDVPADAVTSSGSGLDPDISPAYARLQVHRVAERNHLTVAQVDKLVAEHVDGRILGFVGEPRVNVLQLNLALKQLVAAPASAPASASHR